MTTERRAQRPGSLNAVEAGQILGLPADVVRALSDAGFLRPSSHAGGIPRYALGDLKAFQAQTARDELGSTAFGSLHVAEDGLEELAPEVLLKMLDGRSREMAERAFELFIAVFPEAGGYDDRQVARFHNEAQDRFAAILAVCATGPKAVEPLEEDLADVGSDAAHAGVPLPGVLAMLRVSRDLVVQTAVGVSEERGRHWGLALSVVLTRVLPAIDRLTDAVARGYWEAVLEIEAEGLDRYVNVVERASDGIFEVDVDGLVAYANPALAELLGRTQAGLLELGVGEVFAAVEGPVLVLGEPGSVVAVRGADGTVRHLRVDQFERVRDGIVVGWDGVVRDITAQARVAEQRDDYLRLLAGELPLARRVVQLAPAIGRALRTSDLPDDLAVEVKVPGRLSVQADGRRLDEVLAELLGNAVVHGGPNVRVRARRVSDEVLISVDDDGRGVPKSVLNQLSAELRPLAGVPRRRGAGLRGLAYARGVVEAMAGRLSHERTPDGRTVFTIRLPAAP